MDFLWRSRGVISTMMQNLFFECRHLFFYHFDFISKLIITHQSYNIVNPQLHLWLCIVLPSAESHQKKRQNTASGKSPGCGGSEAHGEYTGLVDILTLQELHLLATCWVCFKGIRHTLTTKKSFSRGHYGRYHCTLGPGRGHLIFGGGCLVFF